MAYACLRTPVTEGDYSLVAIREQDVMSIRDWRNDQLSVLRQQRRLSKEDQTSYYRDVIVPSFSADRPGLVLVSFLQSDRCIGYGGLTHIDWDAGRAEVSFLLETSRTQNVDQYVEDFAAFLRLLQVLAFQRLSFNRMFTETYDLRPYHVAVLERSGFVREGRLREHHMIDGRRVDSLFHGLLREDSGAER